jgi:uncharacterized protein
MAERTCAISRAVMPEIELVRFVLSPDGIVTPDLKRKLPGRGVWIEARRSVVAEAIKRNPFSRGFAELAKVPDDLAEQVYRLMRAEAVQTLALARKAGEAVAGFIKVETVLKKASVSMLIHSPDAARDGCAKLDRMVGEATISHAFTSAELNLAFGSENVIHAAILAGGLAEKLNVLLARLARYNQDQVRHDL